MTEPFLTLAGYHHAMDLQQNGALCGHKRRRSLCGLRPEKGQYLQLVISASYDLLQKPRQEIIDLCLKEVRHALPAARDANLLKATVIKEAAATFSPQPGVDRWRPTQQTSIGGLFLAGDWTATGWPATMEGAVRSGYLAAEAVLRVAGDAETISSARFEAGRSGAIVGKKLVGYRRGACPSRVSLREVRAAFNGEESHQRVASLVMGKPLEAAEFALRKRKFLESLVERQVCVAIV